MLENLAFHARNIYSNIALGFCGGILNTLR